MAFVMVLSWSRQIFLRFFLNAQMENFLRGHVAALSDDAMAGRGPAGDGDLAARAYLVEQMTALGLEPGAGDGSWEQPMQIAQHAATQMLPIIEHCIMLAEVHESLGDFWWTRRNQRNWGQAWPHYEKALDWWAGSESIDRARQRYLGRPAG